MSIIKCHVAKPRDVKKLILAFVIVFVLSILLGAMTAQALIKEVSVTIDGKTFYYKTIKSTVKEVLEENGITVTKDDYVSPALDAKIDENTKIVIKRAFEVKILVDDSEKVVYIPAGTVEDAIKKAGITIGKADKVNLPLSQVLEKPAVIKITRVSEKIVVEKQNIPFPTITKTNYSMDYGKHRIVQQGQNGVLEKRFRVVMEDGKEVERKLIGQKIVKSPKPRIVEVGAIRWFKTSRGEIVRYKKVYTMIATAYTLSPSDTGKSPKHPDYGKTATGHRVRRGVVAVDPRVIPLGTRLYVEGYGFATALDTGSAIKGNRIDVFVEKDAYKFGVRRVKVYVLAD
ncbi:ubiquitin-like domain-containing protein [Caldicellulosiruptor naganoensis]|uniref:Ubiquitin-like domain-containing protein n=1 Tax=Caldicellulosiruptor naganoensis TaxID=29324 RepID=A0ABY7BFS0_9FIRM|nr:ubiquitin-like domain-containing protein [Caldicellulosiruptor naganoensis]WAM31258.1 ubiquitin-like domain-containing protein [Caldicellulosiruptor naganoensis]